MRWKYIFASKSCHTSCHDQWLAPTEIYSRTTLGVTSVKSRHSRTPFSLKPLQEEAPLALQPLVVSGIPRLWLRYSEPISFCHKQAAPSAATACLSSHVSFRGMSLGNPGWSYLKSPTYIFKDPFQIKIMFTGSEDMDVLIEGYYSTDYKGHQWSRRPREESHMDTHMRTQIHECKQSLMPIFLCYSNWCGFCLHNWSVTEPAMSRSSSPQLCWGISSHDVIWQLRWVTRRCDACILCEMLTAGQSAHPHLTQLCWCVCACLRVCLCVCVCVCVCVCMDLLHLLLENFKYTLQYC